MWVYCRRVVETTRQQIGEWIEEGIYFDDTPEFDPPLNSAEASAPEWDSFVIRYAAAKRPVVVVRHGATAGIEEKEEIEEEIEEEFVWPPLDSVLKNRIVEAKQVFILDVNPRQSMRRLDLGQGRRDLRCESAAGGHREARRRFPSLGANHRPQPL